MSHQTREAIVARLREKAVRGKAIIGGFPTMDTGPINDNARVRDHLANERTFLAWLRTGIATMGFGVVIAKLRYLFPTGMLAPPSRGLMRELIVELEAHRHHACQTEDRREPKRDGAANWR